MLGQPPQPDFNSINEPLLGGDPSQQTGEVDRPEIKDPKASTVFEGGGGDDDEEESLNLERMKELIQMHDKAMRHTNRDFYIFEPRNRKEKVLTLAENLFELLLLIYVAVMAILSPSMVSASFFLLTHNFIFTSGLQPSQRIFWGRIAIVFNIVALTGVILVKVYYSYGTERNLYLSENEFHDHVEFWESLGFRVHKDIKEFRI